MLSFNENSFINGLVGGSAYWIGLRKVGRTWMWQDGTAASFTNWRPSQPDGCCGPDVTCTIVNYANAGGQWDDAGCTTLWRNPTNIVCKRAVQ